MNVFQVSFQQTQICKNCFNDIKIDDLYSLMNKNPTLCKNCVATFSPKFYRFRVEGIKAIAIYDYDDLMKDLIYKFKGCYDYELHSIFLERFAKEISILFYGYKVVPAPSYKDDDSKRGFNHVVEIYKSLKLEVLDLFEKTEKFKQADHNLKDRKKIKNYIKLKDNVELYPKLLLVDDIYTTGSTIKTMISALKEKGIRDIKIIILCKTQLTKKLSKA